MIWVRTWEENKTKVDDTLGRKKEWNDGTRTTPDLYSDPKQGLLEPHPRIRKHTHDSHTLVEPENPTPFETEHTHDQTLFRTHEQPSYKQMSHKCKQKK